MRSSNGNFRASAFPPAEADLVDNALKRFDAQLGNHGARNLQYRMAIAQHVNQNVSAAVAALTWTDPKKVAALIAAEEAAAQATAASDSDQDDDES